MIIFCGRKGTAAKINEETDQVVLTVQACSHSTSYTGLKR